MSFWNKVFETNLNWINCISLVYICPYYGIVCPLLLLPLLMEPSQTHSTDADYGHSRNCLWPMSIILIYWPSAWWALARESRTSLLPLPLSNVCFCTISQSEGGIKLDILILTESTTNFIEWPWIMDVMVIGTNSELQNIALRHTLDMRDNSLASNFYSINIDH